MLHGDTASEPGAAVAPPTLHDEVASKPGVAGSLRHDGIVSELDAKTGLGGEPELTAACEPEVEAANEPSPAVTQESTSRETLHIGGTCPSLQRCSFAESLACEPNARDIMRISSDSGRDSRGSDPIYDDDRSSRISRASRMSTRHQLQATIALAKKARGFSQQRGGSLCDWAPRPGHVDNLRLSDQGPTQHRAERIMRKQCLRTIPAETSFDTEWPSTMEGILTKDILQTGLGEEENSAMTFIRYDDNAAPSTTPRRRRRRNDRNDRDDDDGFGGDDTSASSGSSLTAM